MKGRIKRPGNRKDEKDRIEMNRRSMKRIFYWIWIACVAAACGGTACSRGEADEEAVVPAEDGEELSDKPLIIRANIEGLLESRATVAPGRLRDEKWCLSLPLNEHGGAPESKGDHQDYLIADFTKGYGEFTWHAEEDIDTKVPYELTWNKILYKGDGHEIVMSLDNAPVYWDNMQIGGRPFGVGLYHNVDIGWYPDVDYLNFTYLMPFYTEEEAQRFHPKDWDRFRWKTTEDGKNLFDRDRYRAQLEPEDETIAPNDLLAGYWYRGNGTDVKANIRYIDISLKHIMSRVHVEILAPGIPDIGQKKVKVWIDHLASECYGIIRTWHAEMVSTWKNKYPSAIIYPFYLATKPNTGVEPPDWREGWGLLRNTYAENDYDCNLKSYHHDGQDKTIYSKTLYLLGETDDDAKLLEVTDETGKVAYRTHYLIMPPQSTNRGTNLAPRLHLEIDGTRYSCDLPPVITTAGTGQSSLNFDEFKENQDITLEVKVSDEPPKIELAAQVKNWVDKGSWVLETKRGGIYGVDDLIKAVKAFNAYVNAMSDKKLGHAVERYGDFIGGKFIFRFFTDLEGEYPGDAIIAEAGYELFDVEMNGHTIYGCTGAAEVGQDPPGKADLMKKMKGGN